MAADPVRRKSPESSKHFAFTDYMKRCIRMVDDGLNHFLPPATAKPATIHRAMRHSLFAGGKRIRPAVCFAAAEACGGEAERAIPFAAAVECIHTYSLIHDDLPAMDNDDFRRGKPTCHKVFGEGMAILAGDALLTAAFEIVVEGRSGKRYTTQDYVRELSQAAGSRQLIAGQAVDLESEGKAVSKNELRYIHERKTSALLCCSARLGGMSTDCPPAKLQALTDFGRHVGLAFQVIDDILDVTQSTGQLGKTAGKDAQARKATYPSIAGLEASRKIARRLTEKAFDALSTFRGKAVALEALADYLLKRTH